jgi:hypothetical protein|tara:strand:+ start:4805 stop:5206 length:402 start_codon:yes stop_codon:yes gene_type:complete
VSITLSDGSVTIELPEDLIWSDRLSWSPVTQTMTRGLTGAPIIMYDVAQYGRPITLEPPAGGGWMLATNEPQITAWHNAPGQKLTLDFHGEQHTVQFAHHDGPGYESTPLRYQINPGPDYKVIPIFRFITVEP